MTYLFLILSILIWPFGQLLNIGFSGFTIYPLDIAVGLIFISLIFSKERHKKIITNPLFKPLIFFLAAALISLLINYRQVQLAGVTSLLYFVRLIMYPSIFFAITLYPEKNIKPYLLLSLSLFSILGLMQYLFFPDMRFLKYLGFDDHLYRLIGTFFDPNFTGFIFAAAALISLSLGNSVASLFFIALLGLTFSRASYLSFVAGFLFLLISKKNWKLLKFLVFLAVVIILIPKPFGEGVNLLRSVSVFSRIVSWQSGLSLFLEKPVFGWGYNTLSSITGGRFQIDNSFIFVAAATGIVGLGFFINLLKKIYLILSDTQRVLFVTLLVHALFNNSLFYIWIYFIFWLIPALRFKEYKQS